jgi:hypothetical protein
MQHSIAQQNITQHLYFFARSPSCRKTTRRRKETGEDEKRGKEGLKGGAKAAQIEVSSLQ